MKKEIKLALAGTAIVMLFSGCKPKDGDLMVTKNVTPCMKYPTDGDGSRLTAALGQSNLGMIPEGTTVTVDGDDELFGPNQSGYTRVNSPEVLHLIPIEVRDSSGNLFTVAPRDCWVDSNFIEPQK